MTLAPLRPGIVFQEAAVEAPAPLGDEIAVPSHAPFVWSFRDPGRSLVWRFFAHLLIRLLVLTPLPPQFQAASVLFPVSMLWPLVWPAEPVEGSEKAVDGILFAAAVFPLSESLGVAFSGGADPARQQRLDSVGSRMALSDQNILLSTDRAFIKGTPTELGGVQTATLGDLAIITEVKPDPIVVSAGNEVFRNVDLTYKMIPPVPQVGEVQIDVRSGSRVAALPAPIDEAGSGTTQWPQGTIVNLLQTYEARLHVLKDGSEVRSFPRRLRFDKVPLVVTTRDRALRIQFALPEQGLFTERRYAVRVYLAQQGQDFPANPSFTVSAGQIERAYPNVEEWWEGASEGESWVTRKLDRMDLPPGTDTSIRRQAYEIATVLAGYPRVKVTVVSDETGTELKKSEGVVTADGEWSEIIGKVNDRVRRAAGEFVPEEPILPPAGQYNEANIFLRYAGLSVRALLGLLAFNQVLSGFALLGALDGLKDGFESDIAAVELIGKTFTQDPRETAKAIWEFGRSLLAALSDLDVRQVLTTALNAAGSGVRYTLDDVAYLMTRGSYYTGYIIGFLAEQIVVTIILAKLTVVIGAAVQKAALLIKGAAWVGTLSRIVVNVVKTLIFWFNKLSEIGVAKQARKVLLLLWEQRELVDQLWLRYPKAGKVVEGLAKTAQMSAAAGKTALKWLTVVDRMTDEAAIRFITFFEKKTADVGERWLVRWTALRNGKKAVKDGFEAYERTGEAAEGVHDALVVAGDLNPPDVPTTSYPRAYSDKYKAAPDGNRVESSLERLRKDANDTRFDDEAVGETVKFHSRGDVPPMSDDAVEGTARLANIPCTRVASLVILAAIIVPSGCGKVIPDAIANNYPELLTRFERAAENLKHANDVAADEAFARLFWAAHQAGDSETARAVIRAASFPTATPPQVAQYMKALDFMRDPDNANAIITGLLDPPPGVGASINVRRVGNQGGGSIAEGWEPVAMRRLIEGGSPNLPRPITRGDIKNFGEKLDVSQIPGVSTGTIEADCLLKDGTFFDMKHTSVARDPYVTQGQIDNLTKVLAQADPTIRPINRAVFVTNAPVGQAVLDRVREANEAIKVARGISEDLIHVVEDLGGFP